MIQTLMTKYKQLIDMRRLLTISILLILTASQFGFTSRQSSDEQKPLVVFLVRHAEKMDYSKDPELSASGKERALDLVNILRSTNIEHVHSSDFIRTRETAKPTAEEFGLKTEIYDPYDLEGLAQKLRNTGGIHLVVGHSNTTPVLANLLGGKAVSEINEAREYDRIYIIQVSNNNYVSSILMRYGSPYLEHQSK
jgi:phosphohistidine phosphatase SixA